MAKEEYLESLRPRVEEAIAELRELGVEELARRGGLTTGDDGLTGLADAVLSTSGMLEYVAASSVDEFVIVTEEGLLHGLSKVAPHKRFFNISPRMFCRDMKLTTIEKVRDVLRDMTGEVVVPEDVRAAAYTSVERMVHVG